ncbi:MAG: DUF3667 domain-containing protein [Henriciella sp.]|nr:DUF3667 domain-containing protein [Henriciella sp.]
MTVEFEAAGAASVGGLTTRQKADLAGQACKNCGEIVTQRYCTNCGQLAASFHRPILSLIGETIGDTFTLDGRLARTVPILLFRPGRLTKNYTEGKRARYVPPFRLFLLASLLFYLVLFALVPPGQYIQVDDETRAEISQGIRDAQTVEDIPETARERLEQANIHVDAPDEVREGIENQVLAVLENQDQFAAQLEDWLPRLSILLVPMTIISLTILHIWRRSLYIYDHAIHALHLHSWIYLTGAFLMLAGPYLPGSILIGFLFAFFTYVWRSLAVVGSTGFMMSGLRFFLLFLSWVFVSAMIIAATVIVSGLSVRG